MPLVKLSNSGLHYHWAGRDDGPVLVLSHSLGASSEMWRPQLDTLGEYFRILLYDHRGHGRSPLSPRPLTIDDLGRDAIELLDHLRVDRVCFCGLSLGGMVGLWLGQHAADRVERLVLCNCSATIEDATLLRGRMQRIEREGLEPVVDDIVGRWFTPGFGEAHPALMHDMRRMVRRTPAAGYLAMCRMLCDFDLRPGLREIDTPALVICGRHDQANPPAWSHAYAVKLPNHQLVELDAAHLSNVEASDAFNDAVLRFLQTA